MTPRQVEKAIEAFIERKKNEAKEIDAYNFNLGKYVAFAFNDPKGYPSKPFLYENKQSRIMTTEEMERVARRNTIILGGKINVTQGRGTSGHNRSKRRSIQE